MDHEFSCYTPNMAKTLQNENPAWRNSGDACATIRSFFEHLKAGDGRFNVFGPQGKGWQPGDVISFVEQKTKSECARAELVKCVEGAHPDANQGSTRHFSWGRSNSSPDLRLGMA